jgi:hypothetical protein
MSRRDQWTRLLIEDDRLSILLSRVGERSNDVSRLSVTCSDYKLSRRKDLLHDTASQCGRPYQLRGPYCPLVLSRASSSGVHRPIFSCSHHLCSHRCSDPCTRSCAGFAERCQRLDLCSVKEVLSDQHPNSPLMLGSLAILVNARAQSSVVAKSMPLEARKSVIRPINEVATNL